MNISVHQLSVVIQTATHLLQVKLDDAGTIISLGSSVKMASVFEQFLHPTFPCCYHLNYGNVLEMWVKKKMRHMSSDLLMESFQKFPALLVDDIQWIQIL
jgi:hypothetical protein